MRYKIHRQNADGWTDWVQPVENGYRYRCCDCGLVHLMDFRIYNGRVQFRAKRDDNLGRREE